MGGARPKPEPATETTIKVRSALSGDQAAFEWIFLRFSPLLRAQARYRMRARLQRYYDPDDVVSDTWQRALPRLNAKMQPVDGRCTPRIVRFLSTIVINRVNELFREMMRRHGGAATGDLTSEYGPPSGNHPADPGEAVWKLLMVHEEVTRVHAMIEELEPRDREIIILRLFEGQPSQKVAEKLELTVTAVDTRLSRALNRLRRRLPGGVFDEFAEGSD